MAAVRKWSDVITTIPGLEDPVAVAADKFRKGRFRTAGGQVNAPLNAYASLHLLNPTGSGTLITVTQFSVGATSPTDVNYWTDAVSTGTIVTPFNPNRAYEAVPTSAVVRIGSNVLTGGTALSLTTHLDRNGQDRQEYNAVLLPGQSLAVRTQALAQLRLTASVTWIEDPL